MLFFRYNALVLAASLAFLHSSSIPIHISNDSSDNMEPASAFGLAAGILQFIEFTTKLLKECTEIRNSIDGLTVENNDLEMVTMNIHALSVWVQAGAKEPNDEVNNNVKTLATECMKISQQLLDALAKLRAKGEKTKWASFLEALRTVWGKDEIQNLRDRLVRYREEIQFASTRAAIRYARYKKAKSFLHFLFCPSFRLTFFS